MLEVFSIRVAICRFELHIAEAGNLKQKRKVLQSLIQRLRARFNISVTEVGSQDLWQRSELGLAAICHNSSGADRVVQQLISFIESEGRVEIIASRVEIY
ncbi:MAG: DUF503 domain-containing protein [Bacillota bacterium]